MALHRVLRGGGPAAARLRGVADVSAEFEDIRAAVAAQAATTTGWTTIFRRRYRPELCVAVLIPMFQQFTG